LAYLVYSCFFNDVKQDNKLDEQNGITFFSQHGLSNSCVWMFLIEGHWYHPQCAPHGIKRAVYIEREPKDVMVSIWNLTLSIAKANGKHQPTFSEFLRSPLKGRVERNYIPPSTASYILSVPLLWYWSNLAWKETDVLVVKYENLLTDYKKELNRIQQTMQLKKLGNVDPTKMVGVNPGQFPKTNKWKQYFSPDDLAYIDECEKIAQSIPRKVPKE